jgi:hypothetical protein
MADTDYNIDGATAGGAGSMHEPTGVGTYNVDAATAPPPAAKSPMAGTWQNDAFGRDPDVQNIRGAFGEGYRSVPESVTRPGERSIFTPATQESLRNGWLGGWPGAALNVVGDTAGTAIGGLAGVGNSALTLGNTALSSIGLPPSLVRDINLEGTRQAGETSPLPSAWRGDRPVMQELTKAPAPSVYDVWRQRNAGVPPDPTTAAAIELLRRAQPNAPSNIPPPPTPFKGPPYQPPPGTNGGLLNVPPPPGTGFARAPYAAMTADDMLRESRGWYSPADEQAAQGAMIKPSAANDIRKTITDAVPTDPEQADAQGATPLAGLAKTITPYQGQPMSFATAMDWDTRLTQERRAAQASPGGADQARQIGDVQDALRDKIQGLGTDDTTGDPAALAALPNARQAYAQTMKQRQLEEIQYNASLLPDEKQNAYTRSQVTSMLRNDNKMRYWSDDERAALEQALKTGQPSALTNFGVSLVKPTIQAGGGAVGSLLGTPGAIVGSQVAGSVGENLQARLRAALGQLRLGPVSQTLTRNMPPPP